MKFINYLISASLLSVMGCAVQNNTEERSYANLVNPFIGTDFTGNTYPGAQSPFGMVQLSPDNGLPGWDRISGYFYPDSTIAGFSHTHLSGTGAGDLYDISFMPVTLPYREAEAPLGIHSRFSHEHEQAHAGYYQVKLTDYNIDVELTATARCGIQRYTFPEAESAVFLDLKKAMNWDATTDSHIEVVDSVTIRGYRFSEGWAKGQKVYFETRFSKPFQAVHMDSSVIQSTAGGVPTAKPTGMAFKARFDFKTTAGEQITLSTALSGVSMEGASKNLNAEVPKDDFDYYQQQAENNWNEELGKIAVETADKEVAVKFYTALYHAMLAPTIFGDVDGTYFGADRKIHQAEGWTNYSTFSLWDTYRASHPLFTYIAPNRVNDMVKSFLAFYEQNGRLPVWNIYGSETDMMIGNHAIPVIVDAYLKGIGDFDAKKALEACVATANIDRYRGIGLYKKLGYVPYDVEDEYNADNWSLSRTLEYAFDDHCIAMMAKKMGNKDVAATFFARAQNYKNVYNPSTSFMQPRDSHGKFITPFDPEDYSAHICESNAWQYFWSVQHDIPGLIKLVGGQKRFEQKLDSMFTFHPADTSKLPIFSTGMIGQYAHGNEPSHHALYLFNAAGKPWKTQQYAAEVMDKLYLNSPSGLSGNDDCGQMSAWYVFSALGFYPVDPVSGRYEIGTPLFMHAELQLPNGKKLTIKADHVDKTHCYIQSVTIDGKPLETSYITHEQIMSGATLVFKMGNKPGPVWYKNN
ncbi:glycoside hydrolase family 92 protein [Sphingobacterium sp. N143]|uniref:GH92 family glycosyl hydrolase n=1 Tax=Sphingobacterium sp. N143 TaxID=2746727 RepID=UPI002578DE2B|nr:GH92 family glycosyl hydrolase [Sphingobacterium sp. N143]MDM1294224.1 glycoside hydrolase family 92 protein [Sphingobacterium sp. N143]